MTKRFVFTLAALMLLMPALGLAQEKLSPQAEKIPAAASGSESAHLARAVEAGMTDDPSFALPLLDDLRDITAGVRAYRLKQITQDQLAAIVNANHKTLTPNPNRICTIITLYNLASPFIEMFQPTIVLPPMPYPPQCTPPTPAPTKARRLLRPALHSMTSAA